MVVLFPQRENCDVQKITIGRKCAWLLWTAMQVSCPQSMSCPHVLNLVSVHACKLMACIAKFIIKQKIVATL